MSRVRVARRARLYSSARALGAVVAMAWALPAGPRTWAASPVLEAASEADALRQTFVEDIRIQKDAPVLELYDTFSNPDHAFSFRIAGGAMHMGEPGRPVGMSFYRSFSPSLPPTIVLNSFRTGIYGPLGVGTDSASEALHVRGETGQTRVLVEERSQTMISRNLLRLRNNGPATFRFENASSGAIWGFGSIVAEDKFFISRSGASGLDLTLDVAGNLTLLGTLTQLSDRNAKRDVDPIDGPALLRRLQELPLSTWSYKADERGARHVGPMAQDFAAAFGLGADDTHVAPSDVAGVSLAAVQALQRTLGDRERELLDLQLRVAALERALSAESPH